MVSVCRFYLTYLQVFQGIPGFSTCWRLHSYITKFFYLTYLQVFQGIPGFSTCWRLHSYITKFFYLTYLQVFQGIPGFSTCWRLHSYITKFKLNMSGWVTWLSKDTILYYSKYEVYISQNIKTIKYSLLNYRKRDSDEWKAGNAVKKAPILSMLLKKAGNSF